MYVCVYVYVRVCAYVDMLACVRACERVGGGAGVRAAVRMSQLSTFSRERH